MMRYFLVAALVLLLPIPALAIEECGSAKRYTCVVDGDTMWLEGEKLRMQGYDTPETYTNICGGAEEVRLGRIATARLVQLLNGGGVTIERRGMDRYGRTLVILRVNGKDVGDILVAEGLARYWPDGREFWCD